MDRIYQSNAVYVGGRFVPAGIHVSKGRIAGVLPLSSPTPAVPISDNFNLIWLPGLADVHVHLREPGFSYKETMESGTAAAAAGGFTSVCAMPNLDPVPDSPAGLRPQLTRISAGSRVHVFPYGALTYGRQGKEPSDMEGLAPYVCAFSDDGSGVREDDVMRDCMLRAKRLGKVVAAHCEDTSLLGGKHIHDGTYAAKTGRKGISSESEWRQVERDLHLAAETGCAYHVCHVSTKESVQLIREAKRAGLDVTCETAPHYLLLCEDDLQEEGRFKMNPPLRGRADREALLAGLCDGIIDMIATDHAPHSAEEKSGGLDGSAMGVVGLETAFAALYTGLVKAGVLPLERLVYLMHDAPARRFSLDGGIEAGKPADLTAFDLSCRWTVEPERFCSKGRATPFAGAELSGKCILTIVDGKIVFENR
ncbi:MAG: dihydroorotase [Clostridiaceae bacterium]|nr:dihydroorotase [Clostridiaceae bacterium]